ncbi:sigma-54-dependent transcriptional regulator [Flexithrix dorotheae]|uniref:sigma-54-dependent transcriptional regulator n=1 Tax=Flexithrix dorotheae TaxID=70993 RepID=UPI0003687898|nr:sigma-54 dependent transcriptional regulator [Flexithrix dorotheae]
MPKNQGNILVVDDDEDILFAANMILSSHFNRVITQTDPNKALEEFLKINFDVVILDMNFQPGDTSGKEGISILKKIKKKYPDTLVIMNTAYGDIKIAVETMKEGASDFVVKPWEHEKFLATTMAVFELSQSRKKVKTLEHRQKLLSTDIDRSFGEMISTAKSMQPILKAMEKVAVTDANVLILGENGTGKELIARNIHNHSERKNEAFIKVDLGAISETLFESELFGHKKGAFTDARENRIGRFEAASGGTLFLDEIGNLSLPLQAKLLTVIQNKQVIPVGANTPVPIDIRLICATNKPIQELAENSSDELNSFRQDLLYRINTVELKLPPLRERKEDISPLLSYYLSVYGKKYDKEYLRIGKETEKSLKRYSWPGNIRELQHAVERAVIMSDGKSLKEADFLLKPVLKSNEQISNLNLEIREKEAIIKAMEKHHGNMTKVAKELGVGRTTLYRRMQKYDL